MRLSRIKTAQIVLAALSAGGFLATIAGIGFAGQLAGVIVSTVLLAVNAYTKDYDLGEIAQKHKHAAADIWLIRERYLSLLTDIMIGERSLSDLQTTRDDLTTSLHAVYRGAPCTTPRAYTKARDALQVVEELTFSDKEIDEFLPIDLRRATRDTEAS